jgi:hypothetical protein
VHSRDHSHRPQRALPGSFPPCFYLNFEICLNILGRLGRVLQYSGAAVHGRVVAIVSHGVARLVYLFVMVMWPGEGWMHRGRGRDRNWGLFEAGEASEG